MRPSRIGRRPRVLARPAFSDRADGSGLRPPSLLNEALKLVGVAAEFLAQELDRDLAVEFRVLSEKDLAHSALADKGDDPVLVDDRSLFHLWSMKSRRKACPDADTGPLSNAAPSSRQNILVLSRPHSGHRFIRYSPKRIRNRSSTLSMVCGETLPSNLTSLDVDIERTSSHLIKLVIVNPPSGGVIWT